jgi:hypothetical protein
VNRTCAGDVFVRWGRTYGRCLADSSFFEMFEGLEFCPNCRRPWTGSHAGSWDPEADDGVAREIDVPHLKRALEEKEHKLRHLEAELERWKGMCGAVY